MGIEVGSAGYSVIRSLRMTPRPGRLNPLDLRALREQVYAEQKGLCDVCQRPVPLDGDVFHRIHLAHRRNRRMWGDGRDNVHGLCFECHIIDEHNPKACPRKVTTA